MWPNVCWNSQKYTAMKRLCIVRLRIGKLPLIMATWLAYMTLILVMRLTFVAIHYSHIRFRVKFHWNFFPRVQFSRIGSNNGLAPNRQQAIIWTNDVLGCRCIYVSFRLNELIAHRHAYKTRHLYLKRLNAILAWFLPVVLTNTYPYSMYTSKSS